MTKKAAAKKAPARKPAPAKAVAKPEVRAAVLSDLEQRFCEEYLVDLNGTQAYLRCKPGVKETSARAESSRMLAKPNVQAEIARLKAERSERTGISAERTILEAWAIMTADPRELMEYKIGACRHCWGNNFRRQRTDEEFRRAKAEHAQRLRDAKPKDRALVGQWDPEGGPGFLRSRAPNSACPECCGDGEGRPVFKDTRTISPAAASLFAGIKETKEGMEFRLHSKDAAMDKMFRHQGLYNDKIQLTMPTVLIKDMTGRKGKGAAEE